MRLRFEQEVAHNSALGAAALWQFAAAFFKSVGGTEGPPMPLVMLVLPMAFHGPTRRAIHLMREESGLLKALSDDPTIPAGLQRRVEAHAPLTFTSLSVAIATDLIERDAATPWPRFTPRRKSAPEELLGESEDVKQIIGASKRLGWWFAGMDTSVVLRRLHVSI